MVLRIFRKTKVCSKNDAERHTISKAGRLRECEKRLKRSKKHKSGANIIDKSLKKQIKICLFGLDY